MPAPRKPNRHNDMFDFIRDMEDELKINEHALDDELKRHPELRNDIGRELALAKSRRDQAELRIKQLEAEVARDYRDAAKKEEEKVTEGEIKAHVTLDKEVIAAKQEHINLDRDVNLLQALYDAYKDRGYSIARLCDLWLANYYDKETVRGPDNNMKDARAKEAKENLKAAYRRERDKEVPF
jgi:hypothetical protein